MPARDGRRYAFDPAKSKPATHVKTGNEGNGWLENANRPTGWPVDDSLLAARLPFGSNCCQRPLVRRPELSAIDGPGELLKRLGGSELGGNAIETERNDNLPLLLELGIAERP
jgi:hypothetical protein